MCIYVCHVHSWCPQRPEEGIGSPTTGFTKLLAALWVLGTDPGSSIREESSLSSEAFPPSSSGNLKFWYLILLSELKVNGTQI